MIEGFCRTNLDGYNTEEWPKTFVAVPRKGECVRSKSGRYLKVCRVTHESRKYIGGVESEPLIEVELTNIIEDYT